MCLHHDLDHPVQVALATCPGFVPLLKRCSQRFKELDAAGADEDAGRKPVQSYGPLAVQKVDEQANNAAPHTPYDHPSYLPSLRTWVCLVHVVHLSESIRRERLKE